MLASLGTFFSSWFQSLSIISTLFMSTEFDSVQIFAGLDDSQQAQKNGGVAVDDRGCGGGPNTKQL